MNGTSATAAQPRGPPTVNALYPPLWTVLEVDAAAGEYGWSQTQDHATVSIVGVAAIKNLT
jgi:hypothetical protein